jgi:hypothetical protein
MTTNETLRKAEAALDIIDKYDEQNSDVSFKEVLREIIERWRSNN